MRNEKSDIRGKIPHKYVSKKSPTAEKNLTYISKTSASDIDLLFVNETIKDIGKKNHQIKLQRLQKVQIWAFGLLVTPNQLFIRGS